MLSYHFVCSLQRLYGVRLSSITYPRVAFFESNTDQQSTFRRSCFFTFIFHLSIFDSTDLSHQTNIIVNMSGVPTGKYMLWVT